MGARGSIIYCAALALVSCLLVLWTLNVRLPQAQREIGALEAACCSDAGGACLVVEPRVLRWLSTAWQRRTTKGEDLSSFDSSARFLQITEDEAYLCSEDETTGSMRVQDLACHTRLLA